MGLPSVVAGSSCGVHPFLVLCSIGSMVSLAYVRPLDRVGTGLLWLGLVAWF